MRTTYNILFLLAMTLFCACQDKDYEISSMILDPIDETSIVGELQGDDLVWTWTDQSDLLMEVTLYVDGTKNGSTTVDGNSYTLSQVDTNVEYTFVFKLTDGTNYSSGVVKSYTREGASQITGLTMAQVEKEGGYDAQVTWNASDDATSITFTATNGDRTISESLDGTVSEYLIEDVEDGETWSVTLTAVNSLGSSLATTASLKIGKTLVGFLSEYATVDELLENGDVDEASAWLWLTSEYSTAEYVYFGDITSTEDVEQFRVLFWLRDMEGVDEEDVWNMPQVALDALDYIKEWYTDGGSLLLWSHAIPYITNLGRVDATVLRSNDRVIATSEGSYNADAWAMAVQLNPGGNFTADFSSHAIYNGLDVTTTDNSKLIYFKGPGWTEDHNCLFYEYPSYLTGYGNQEESCYTTLTEQYGIYPLGVWDSQIDWVSQLNVWEAQQGDTEFQGTILCIGNGGCEFSMKNDDGTPDISAYPSNNIYQDNILTLARNSIEYLKTR